MEQPDSTAVGMENEEDQGALVGCCKHYVGRRPQVTWRAEMDQQNLSFLRGIDAHYFGHIADTHMLLLETESKHYAAAAIRVAYGQALETLMALIGATVGLVVTRARPPSIAATRWPIRRILPRVR